MKKSLISLLCIIASASVFAQSPSKTTQCVAGANAIESVNISSVNVASITNKKGKGTPVDCGQSSITGIKANESAGTVQFLTAKGPVSSLTCKYGSGSDAGSVTLSLPTTVSDPNVLSGIVNCSVPVTLELDAKTNAQVGIKKCTNKTAQTCARVTTYQEAGSLGGIYAVIPTK